MFNFDGNAFNSAYSLHLANEKEIKANETLKQERENEPNVLALKQINKTIKEQNKIIYKQRQDLEEERKQRAIDDKVNKKLTIIFTVLNLLLSLIAIIVSVVLHFA